VASVSASPRSTCSSYSLPSTRLIEAKLRNAEELDYPRDKVEVIVIADGSDDETVARAMSVPRTGVLHEAQRRGKAVAVTGPLTWPVATS
jgi:cellulose synthase/poly-beta-1,6-N-acetylglucosamine synthase-like glycosyltransferase